MKLNTIKNILIEMDMEIQRYECEIKRGEIAVSRDKAVMEALQTLRNIIAEDNYK